jgi:hypothetical protein
VRVRSLPFGLEDAQTTDGRPLEGRVERRGELDYVLLRLNRTITYRPSAALAFGVERIWIDADNLEPVK